MYTAKEIANWFLSNINREVGESITHLKLQKLLYYAQAWHMVLTENGKPLFCERIEAWSHGPVVKELYPIYADYGFESIPIPDEHVELDMETLEVLNEVMRVYGKYDAKYLEKLTHQESPWQIVRADLPLEARCSDEIPKDIIKTYYSEMYEQSA
jgi:uncharacterized phage-associated protein